MNPRRPARRSHRLRTQSQRQRECRSGYVEPSLMDARTEDHFQFERHGYFVADRFDSKPGVPVFNRAVTLKDNWATKVEK